MSNLSSLNHHLPFLRRFARAMTGSQKCGDALAVASLHMMSSAGDPSKQFESLRVRLYRTLIATFLGPVGAHLARLHDATDALDADDLERLDRLALEQRLAFLLASLEGFSNYEISQTLGLPEHQVVELLADAMAEISKQTKTDVLIIEDEVFISRDLARIVTSLGHEVTGRVRTHSAAIESIAKRRPGLVLADIQLADGSNGIDAVHQILASGDLPVIFITAYPDRLLTGMRPEPTFLISKPFSVPEVRAAVSQVLFFGNTARRLDGVKTSTNASIVPLNTPTRLMTGANSLPC